MSLLSLPNELLTMIVSHLETDKDILAVVKSSRELHDTFIGHLYVQNIKHRDASSLLWCCQTGNIDGVKYALMGNPNLQEISGKRIGGKQQHLYHPLEMAAASGHTHIIKQLLSYDPNVSRSGALAFAVWNGDEEAVKLLLEFKSLASPVDLYYLGTFALIACGSPPSKSSVLDESPGERNANYDSVVNLLVLNGAELSTMDSYERTILHYIAMRDHMSIRPYLGQEVGVNSKDYGRATPLHYAVQHGEPRFNTCEDLILHGADVNSRDNRGNTALHYAVAEGATKTIKLLILNGALLDNRNSKGETPLHLAFKTWHLKAWDRVEILLRAGANANCMDLKEHTPLHYLIPTKSSR